MEDQAALDAAWNLARQLWAMCPSNAEQTIAAATIVIKLARFQEAEGGLLPTYPTVKLAQEPLNGSQGRPSERV